MYQNIHRYHHIKIFLFFIMSVCARYYEIFKLEQTNTELRILYLLRWFSIPTEVIKNMLVLIMNTNTYTHLMYFILIFF